MVTFKVSANVQNVTAVDVSKAAGKAVPTHVRVPSPGRGKGERSEPPKDMQLPPCPGI